MKVKNIDALREQISHDPREAFTKHQVWLLVSEHNKTTPTFDAVPKSELQDIKAEIDELDFDFGDFYDHTKTIHNMIDEVWDKHISGEEQQGENI